MSYMKIAVLSFFCLVVFFGCGLRETVVQKEQLSYLSFTGDISNSIVHIDDLEPIVLNSNHPNNKNVQYELSSGKHHIVVLKDGKEVVNRILLLGSGSVKEIKIP